MPDDPFDANGRPIRYRPDADPPVLYSIGYDGKDDRGTFHLIRVGIVLEKKELWEVRPTGLISMVVLASSS